MFCINPLLHFVIAEITTFLVAEVCFYLCIKGDEYTRYPTSEYPTRRKIQSHLCWIMMSPSKANFSFSAKKMTPNTKILLQISSQQITFLRA